MGDGDEHAARIANDAEFGRDPGRYFGDGADDIGPCFGQRIYRVAAEADIQPGLRQFAQNGYFRNAGQVAAQDQEFSFDPTAHAADLHIPPGLIGIAAQHGQPCAAVDDPDKAVTRTVTAAQAEIVGVDNGITGLRFGQPIGVDRAGWRGVQRNRRSRFTVCGLQDEGFTRQFQQFLLLECCIDIDASEGGQTSSGSSDIGDDLFL